MENKKELVKGLRLISQGFETLANYYDISTRGEKDKVENPIVETVVDTKKVDTVPNEVVEEKVAAATMEEVEEILPQEKVTKYEDATLQAMSYNEIKALAKELGLKAVGSKKAIIENILALNTSDEIGEATEEEPVEEVSEVAEVEEPVSEDDMDILEDDEEELDEDEEELEEETTETLYDKVVSDLEAYSDEELADILSEVGVSPKGKRQALLAKIVQAIEDGKLEWEDSETEEPQSEDEIEVEEEIIEETDEDEEGMSFEGSNTRLNVIQDYSEKLYDDYEEGKLSDKEIVKFLKNYYNGKYTSNGTQADLDEYIRVNCELVDDEGDVNELSTPYYVGDDVYCCGSKLKELKDDLFCEICGTEYEQ